MMKPLIAIVALPALAGCMYSGTVWVRSGGSDAERARDMAQCEYETMRSTQQLNYYPGGLARELDRGFRREELAAYCMKARGYVPASAAVAGPSPSGYIERPSADTPAAPPTVYAPPAKIGKFMFEAEKFAKAERCSSAPAVTLTATGPGFENYSVTCADGDALAVRCDLGNCRILK